MKLCKALIVSGMGSLQASQLMDIPRSTLYRWKKRLVEKGPRGLEDGSRRPKHLRCPGWGFKLGDTIDELRQLYPCWGKNKLKVLLAREGLYASLFIIGRILKYLRRRNLLSNPALKHVFRAKRRSKRSFAIRKPREFEAKQPGDLVQIDTLNIHPFPGWHCKHFIARDVV